jgi:hypothetical protein
MIIFSKKYFFSTILIFSFLLLPSYSCHRNSPGYNPYLRSKPTVKQQRDNKKAIDQGNKNYRKQLRRNRRHIYGTSKPAN